MKFKKIKLWNLILWVNWEWNKIKLTNRNKKVKIDQKRMKIKILGVDVEKKTAGNIALNDNVG